MKLKRFICIGMVLAMTLSAVTSVFAQKPVNIKAASYAIVEYQVEGGYIYFDKSTGKITDSYKGITKADIPEEIDNVRVTAIGDEAFVGCTGLTEITIPKGVASIGNRAFSDCRSLTDIEIPCSVTSVGDEVFVDCSSLKSITVEQDNTQYTSIDGVLFNKNISTLICYPKGKPGRDYTIPKSVTDIGHYAFYGCSSLTSIKMPKGLTSIGHYAFFDCSSLTWIDIPGSVTAIGSYAFTRCSSLKSVTIPKGVTGIGNGTFAYCSSLTHIDIPGSVASIGQYAFMHCSSLTGIEIPKGVTYIDYCTFYCCTDLTYMVIPRGVTGIGDRAFTKCSSLTGIEIPSSVTSVGSFAFDECSSLTDVYYRGAGKEWEKIFIDIYNSCLTGAEIHCNQRLIKSGDVDFRGLWKNILLRK